MGNPLQLSDLQLGVMRVLWDLDEATVADVHAALQADRGLAPTTVSTLLARLEKRGVVAHRTEGRQFVYRAAISEGDVRRSMVGQLAEQLFDGDLAELVSHLLTGSQIGPGDLARVKALIEAHQSEADTDEGATR